MKRYSDLHLAKPKSIFCFLILFDLQVASEAMNPSVFLETLNLCSKIPHSVDSAPVSPLFLLSLLYLLFLYPHPPSTGMSQVYSLSVFTYSIIFFQSHCFNWYSNNSQIYMGACVSPLNSRLKYTRVYSISLLGWYNRNLKFLKSN